jgi:beta-galactosidase
LKRPLVLLLMALAAATACRRHEDRPAAAASPKPVPGERETVLLSGPWRFHASNDLEGAEAPPFDDHAWEAVGVPHTWGEHPWRRAWYRMHFVVPRKDVGRPLYLVFEGAATFADVYVNGAHLGQHRGAFTRFVFDARPAAVEGDNVLAVRLTNDPADTVDSLPSGLGKQLYRLYGGLYRKVWLVKTHALHVDPTEDASPGVYVTPSNVTAQAADLAVKVLVRNAGAARLPVEVRCRLLDAAGGQVVVLVRKMELDGGASAPVSVAAKVDQPRLWSPSDPYLYRVRAEVVSDGRVVDAVEQRTGFRDFRITDGRFLLNGSPIALRGAGKHQETEAHATAVTDDELREDFAGLKDLGVNCVRLAHYPHAALEYDLADEAGILVWAENGHSNTSKITTTGDMITREMVRQNYNHPSIVMWSVGNETGFVRVNRYAAVVRAEDPQRLITYASNTGPRGKRYPLLDFIAQNTYRGWYRGTPGEFAQKAREMRFVSESGAGSVITHHTDYADARRVVDRFEPEEYRQRVAETHFQVVFREQKDLPLYMLWVFRDFGIDKYKGRNTKGLLTYAGLRKDTYALYKAFLRPEVPVVHLTSKTYFLRRGRSDNGIKAYSNRPELTLMLNGEDRGRRRNGEFRHPDRRVVDNVFYWPVALREGRNEITVTDGAGHSDSAVVYFHGRGGRRDTSDSPALVEDLRSSNPASPAFFVDDDIKPEWPFYYEFDGSADNTFHSLPPALEGARWISTRRLSKPQCRTDLSFELRQGARPAKVYVLFTEGTPFAAALSAAGFRDANLAGHWRDNDLRLVGFRAWVKEAKGGDKISVPGTTADYVVLVQPS